MMSFWERKRSPSVDFTYGGEIQDFINFLSLLDDFDFWFPSWENLGVGSSVV